MHIINDPSECPIRPSDIDTSKPFWDAFGDFRTEQAACVVVAFYQNEAHNRWIAAGQQPFTRFQWRTYQVDHWQWHNLLKEGWVVQGPDELFRVTIEFVARCYAAAPKARTLAQV